MKIALAASPEVGAESEFYQENLRTIRAYNPSALSSYPLGGRGHVGSGILGTSSAKNRRTPSTAAGSASEGPGHFYN